MIRHHRHSRTHRISLFKYIKDSFRRSWLETSHASTLMFKFTSELLHRLRRVSKLIFVHAQSSTCTFEFVQPFNFFFTSSILFFGSGVLREVCINSFVSLRIHLMVHQGKKTKQKTSSCTRMRIHVRDANVHVYFSSQVNTIQKPSRTPKREWTDE